MLRLTLLVAILGAATTTNGQTWKEGDNSTVQGCSMSCSLDDANGLGCWNSNLRFFEKTLLGQLRHYVAVLVDIDQWNRRHGSKKGLDFTVVRTDALTAFKALFDEDTPSHDLLNWDTMSKIVDEVVSAAGNYSDHTVTWMPHYQCPIPCEYRSDVFKSLFIVSLCLNAALLIAVLPYVRAYFRAVKDEQRLVE